jgi:hypothetical protein
MGLLSLLLRVEGLAFEVELDDDGKGSFWEGQRDVIVFVVRKEGPAACEMRPKLAAC